VDEAAALRQAACRFFASAVALRGAVTSGISRGALDFAGDVWCNAMFGGATFKGSARYRDWCAREQELEGHRRPLGSTRTAEFEKA
jgi:hypothetical protein